MTEDAKPRRRWFRFSSRGLLIFIGLLSLAAVLSFVVGMLWRSWIISDAVRQENLSGIEEYAKAGNDLNAESLLSGKTPLLYALEMQKRKSFKRLLDLGANPNTECRGGKIAVHYAANETDPYWLSEALKAGGDPNLMNHGKGLTKGRPLYYAITGVDSRIETVKLLVEHGADIDTVIDGYGDESLTIACQRREFNIVNYLLSKGADFNKPKQNIYDSFIYTVRTRRPDDVPRNLHDVETCKQMWEWLKDHNVDPDKAVWDQASSKWIIQP